MSIIPLQLARVSNALRMNLSQRTITQTQRSLLDVQNQLSTGRRLTTPSDDPGDAAIAIQIRKLLEQRAGFEDNLKQASSHLSEVDTTLGDMTDLLRQAQTLASANVGSDVSADQRAAAAAIVSSLYNQMLSVANKQSQGVYLFAGDTGQAPFVSDQSGVRYVGSSRVLQNRFDESAILPFMVDGNEVFGALSSRIQGTTDLSPALTTGTRLADLRGATDGGVHGGAIVLSDGTTTKTVDLSTADTIGNVIDLINAATVGGITASIAPGGAGLLLSATGADNITLTDSGGTVAADLGIVQSTPAGLGVNITGAPLNPNLTILSNLSDLRGGAGIDLTGLIITNGSKTATVDFTTATTVEDLLNRINQSGTGVLARLSDNGTGIDILNPVQGTQMTVAENGGATAADLGVRSFDQSSLLSELNGGRGVTTVAGADIQITRRDGTNFSVDLSGLNTVADVITAINTADAGGGVTASFATTGNGIVLTDSTVGGSLSVSSLNASPAAADLGINTSSPTGIIAGADVNSVEATGIFGNLGKLREALLSSDQTGITHAAEALQNDLDRIIRFHGQVGAQVKEFEARQNRLADQNVATKAMLSELEDTDFNEAITRFQTLQTALQANLQTTSRLLDLNLLDFLS
ncbi:MAG TPA: flagellar hook-associated protein FlgL [Tepidisphaeraceae bacterium]|nr:flagellar hook-associated protein FlgL [Tepidisphaeraceae bacterium]